MRVSHALLIVFTLNCGCSSRLPHPFVMCFNENTYDASEPLLCALTPKRQVRCLCFEFRISFLLSSLSLNFKAATNMTRIPYQSPTVGTSVVADAIRKRRGSRGLSPLDKALLNAPEIAVSWPLSAPCMTQTEVLMVLLDDRMDGIISWELSGLRIPCRTTSEKLW
jgi:hypothetical protein